MLHSPFHVPAFDHPGNTHCKTTNYQPPRFVSPLPLTSSVLGPNIPLTLPLYKHPQSVFITQGEDLSSTPVQAGG